MLLSFSETGNAYVPIAIDGKIWPNLQESLQISELVLGASQLPKIFSNFQQIVLRMWIAKATNKVSAVANCTRDAPTGSCWLSEI